MNSLKSSGRNLQLSGSLIIICTVLTILLGFWYVENFNTPYESNNLPGRLDELNERIELNQMVVQVSSLVLVILYISIGVLITKSGNGLSEFSETISNFMLTYNPTSNDLSKNNKSKYQLLQSLISKKDGESINKYLREQIQTKEDGLSFIKEYRLLFISDLVKNLCNVSDSYKTISKTLSLLIELEIVEDKYPHSYTKSSQIEF